MKPEPKKMNKLLEEARAALIALPAEALERPRIARERALSLTRIVKREFRTTSPRLTARLNGLLGCLRASPSSGAGSPERGLERSLMRDGFRR